jgi:hypothetical protein
MFWVILWILAVIAAIAWAIKDTIDWGCFSGAGLLISSLTLIIGFSFAVLGLGLSNAYASEYSEYIPELSEEYEIVTMGDNQVVEGDFFIGIGDINTNSTYTVMAKTDNGYERKTFDAKDVVLKTTDKTPKVQVYAKKFTKPSTVFFCGDYGDETYVIYIPKEAIIENYWLDLQ